MSFQVIDWVYVGLCAAPLLYAILASSRRQPASDRKPEKPIEFEEPEPVQQRQVMHRFCFIIFNKF